MKEKKAICLFPVARTVNLFFIHVSGTVKEQNCILTKSIVLTSVSRSLIDRHEGGAIQETTPGILTFIFNVESGFFLHLREMIWQKGRTGR